MNKASHIIQQQSIEIGFNGFDDGVGMQDRIAEIFYTRLQPKMSSLFNEIADEKHLLSLDKLAIDCEVLDEKNWEDEFIEKAISKLKAELLTKHKKVLSATGEINDEAEKAFLYFLEHGYLQWNVQARSLRELEQSLTLNTQLIGKLKTLIKRQPRVAQRLALSSSELFKDQLVNMVVGESENKKVLLQIYNTSALNERIILQEFILTLFFKDQYEAGQVKNAIKKLAKRELKIDSALMSLVDRLDKEHGQIGDKEKDKPGEVDNSIYINNAGLVLLHPFLAKLFEVSGLWHENKWNNDFSQQQAVKILGYLSTGKNEFEEIHFVFNKILCGMDIRDHADDNGQLNDDTANACDILIMEVVGYWQQLKNTSIEAFRETFLQRPGKLSKVGNGWLLQVENSSIDILLDSLPWGIGIVKLPWMQDMVYTEWR